MRGVSLRIIPGDRLIRMLIRIFQIVKKRTATADANAETVDQSIVLKTD
jgi:hypothetical protein